MAVNKNQLVGQRGRADNNEFYNGGDRTCLRKYNSANCGTKWKTKGKWGPKGKHKLDFSCRRKIRNGLGGRGKERIELGGRR